MNSKDINLLKYADFLERKKIDQDLFVLCFLRKKWILLTPEETVRQLMIHFLIQELKVPATHIAVEKKIKVGQRDRRFDLLIYDRQLRPLVLIECKSVSVPLNQVVMEQLSHYNSALKVPFLLVTNGQQSYLFLIDYMNNSHR